MDHDAQFVHGTRGCRYMVAMPLTSINNDFPAYYPLQRIAGRPGYKIIPIMPEDGGGEKKPALFLIRKQPSG